MQKIRNLTRFAEEDTQSIFNGYSQRKIKLENICMILLTIILETVTIANLQN